MANRKIKADLEIDGKDNTSAAFRSVATRMGQVEKRIASFNRTAKDFNKTAEGFNKRLKDIDKTSQAVSRRQAEFAKNAHSAYAVAARYAAPTVLAYGAKRALTDFAAVNREMNRIGITAGASVAETDAAFSKLQEMAKKTALPIDGAISALDTLVASGLSLKEAMDFLPSVLATAQASGAATTDIANTALKASSALKIQAGDMQHAFDIMVTGGKAGQFELKDMAAYLPNLANLFASLGYKGEGGLKRLVAILQTVREDTGNASDAATYAENVFIKMNSRETIGNFKKFGIDLNAEMAKAKKNGEDVIDAFVRLSKLAVKGDLTKLPQLFGDQQMLLGMQSLMTSADSLKRFFDTMNGAEVDGTVWRDLDRVTGDTQSSIDRLQSSWDKLWNSLGKTVSRPAVPLMDAISRGFDQDLAISAGMDGLGWKGAQRFAPRKTETIMDLSYAGGFNDPEFLKKYYDRLQSGLPDAGRAKDNILGFFQRSWALTPKPVAMLPRAGSAADGGDRGATLDDFLNGPQAMPSIRERKEIEEQRAAMPDPDNDRRAYAAKRFFRVPSRDEWRNALKIDMSGTGGPPGVGEHPSKDELPFKVDATDLKQSADEAGKSVTDASRQAGDMLKSGGDSAGASILAAARALIDAANRLSNINIKVQNASSAGGAIGGMSRPQPNADTGKSNTFAAAPPGGAGGGGGF
ncbi:phage tail tape measure protein [Agrobacterium rhizogenes]|uniref:phage tail tape measure protein n=1 Tax=Rhizobium rhizogenes TaxID=359 RepID=UPI001573C936|nr:phage tail tape measure protein [Rhizobium rhizogenes]NTF87493.1 phage tail tape measure protein [Rhizobium rhizogenes]